VLSFLGPPSRSCEGPHRRTFLKLGALALGGLALPDLLRLRASASAEEPARDTAVIQLFLSGGPSQHDTFDPKPDAPAEYRGPFKSIPTSLPGVRFTELFPRLARLADRLTVLRSVHHNDGSHHHSYHWMQTGYYPANLRFYVNERPAAGAVAAKVCGPRRAGVPPYVTIPRGASYGNAGYLGIGYNPFEAGDPNAKGFGVRNLQPPPGVSADRLADRRVLLGAFDRMRRDIDATGTARGMDSFARAAFDLVTGPAAREAFDLAREPAALRDRYGRTRVGQGCLLARRLVEAGVTFVTVEDFEFTEWDLHGGAGGGMGVEPGTKVKGPHLDAALGTLVTDLADRGLLGRVLVQVFGEFGRTPKINPSGGRDHWGNVFSVLLAGGGLRHGRVVGASTAKGEYPRDRPLRPEDVLATTYHVLGIDRGQTAADPSGRPVAFLPGGEAIKELL
jgi:uncharacterized protein (DUF1501 family)